MTKVFIGGSRKLTRLSADVRRRIDTIIKKHLRVLVGDANGADKAVQQYLKGYESVEVFCAGGKCRNNLGHWPVRAVSVEGKSRGFDFYAAKDRVMADEASVGLMIWDGASVGTLMNMVRLLRQHKTVVAYVAPAKAFEDLRAQKDLDALVTRHAPDLRERLERESRPEQPTAGEPRQASLF
jgi:adenine-specific DNA-methyltransferase